MMTQNRRTSWLSYVALFLGIGVFIFGFIYIKQTYNQHQLNHAEVAWKGSAFQWSELAAKDTGFVSSLESKYIELEGVLLNVVVSQGATTLYFTSGFQTDSSYLVGQQPEWESVSAQSTRSSCDTLILMYGKNYNLQPAPVLVQFYGDAVNSESDKLLNFSFFETCDYTKGKTHAYRLHNFCANRITVRAQLKQVIKEDKGLTVELNDLLILSNEKNTIKMQ